MGVDDLVVAPILIAGAKVVGAAMIKYYNITYNLTIFLNEFIMFDVRCYLINIHVPVGIASFLLEQVSPSGMLNIASIEMRSILGSIAGTNETCIIYKLDKFMTDISILVEIMVWYWYPTQFTRH